MTDQEKIREAENCGANGYPPPHGMNLRELDAYNREAEYRNFLRGKTIDYSFPTNNEPSAAFDSGDASFEWKLKNGEIFDSMPLFWSILTFALVGIFWVLVHVLEVDNSSPFYWVPGIITIGSFTLSVVFIVKLIRLSLKGRPKSGLTGSENAYYWISSVLMVIFGLACVVLWFSLPIEGLFPTAGKRADAVFFSFVFLVISGIAAICRESLNSRIKKRLSAQNKNDLQGHYP